MNIEDSGQLASRSGVIQVDLARLLIGQFLERIIAAKPSGVSVQLLVAIAQVFKVVCAIVQFVAVFVVYGHARRARALEGFDNEFVDGQPLFGSDTATQTDLVISGLDHWSEDSRFNLLQPNAFPSCRVNSGATFPIGPWGYATYTSQVTHFVDSFPVGDWEPLFFLSHLRGREYCTSPGGG